MCGDKCCGCGRPLVLCLPPPIVACIACQSLLVRLFNTPTEPSSHLSRLPCAHTTVVTCAYRARSTCATSSVTPPLRASALRRASIR
jgi:hypothetical protein